MNRLLPEAKLSGRGLRRWLRLVTRRRDLCRWGERRSLQLSLHRRLVKIPELGDKILASRYKIALKAGKSTDDVAKMIDEDAQSLATKIHNSGDSEATKLGKLEHLYQQQKFLKAKTLAGELGKTSGLSKTAKQGLRRPESFGESATRDVMTKERLAASPSTKQVEDEFISRFGREPNDSERILLEATRDPSQAVDQEFQEEFERKKAVR